jgi:hypothetical protein
MNLGEIIESRLLQPAGAHQEGAGAGGGGAWGRFV